MKGLVTIKQEKERERLAFWKDRFENSQNEYKPYLTKMDKWWAQYLGDRTIDQSHEDGYITKEKKANLVRNFTFELIETQIDSVIPQPKVAAVEKTPKKMQNARVIEAMLKNLLAKLPIERINNEEERLTKALGATFKLLGWDSTKTSRTSCGEPFVRLLHPKQVIPQAGVCDISLMDYVFILFDDTKERLNRRYNVNIDANEQTQTDDLTENPAEVITQISAYYINKSGTLGVFSWAGNTVLEDEEQYRGRMVNVCTKCCRILPQNQEICQCGADSSKFEKSVSEYETLMQDIYMDDGQVIPIFTKIPYYTPKVFPVMIRKNVSLYGDFLGDSDCEKIRDLQQAHNRLASKMQQKMLKGGSVLTLPKNLRIETSDREDKLIYLDSPTQKSMIDAISLQPSIQQDYQMLLKYYEDARSTLGITDSFQGKNDLTAISGTARQFAANQTAGRLESKNKMKKVAYAELFEAMFEYMLAYADEPRVFTGLDAETGDAADVVFNRYDFLEMDENGEWYYDDNYIFEVDNSAPLINDRQAMWAEVRLNFQNGTLGNPSAPTTIMLFWKQMELLDYPNAGLIYKQLQLKTKQTETLTELNSPNLQQDREDEITYD